MMPTPNEFKVAAQEELAALLVRLPVEAIKLLIELISGALKSDDPVRYLQRRAAADASALASEEAIDATLKASATKKGA